LQFADRKLQISDERDLDFSQVQFCSYFFAKWRNFNPMFVFETKKSKDKKLSTRWSRFRGKGAMPLCSLPRRHGGSNVLHM